MVSITKAYTNCSGGQVHCHRLPGDDKADGPLPVVFFHQTASSGRMFYQVMTRLAGSRPLVAFDTPGFGGSFDPDGMPSMADYADWLAEAAADAGLDRYHVVGHHTGACVGVELTARHPARVASLSMIGPVPLTAEERTAFREHYSTPFSPTPDGAYLNTTWDYLAGLGAGSDVDLHHRELVDTVRAYWGRYQAYSAVWDQDFVAHYTAVSCPLMILCATDDVLMPYFDRARDMRPDAVAVTLAGSNFEPDQDPDGVATALRDFLATVAE